MNKSLAVLVVDDQQLLRRGLTLLLETEPGIRVVAQAAHGREALAILDSVSVDAVLTDAKMPTMGGVDLARECARVHPGLPVIVLTTFDEPDLVRGALAAGAAGFLLKDSSPSALAEALRSAVGGGMVIDPRVAKAALAPQPAGAVKEDSRLAVLTPTERSVARLVATGCTNREIAEAVHLAEGTVKNHVSSLLRKMRARDRTALALVLAKTLGEAPDSGPARRGAGPA
ncbi:MAG: response regulator transcription factor [Dermabacter sp.]|nr:response regulator transcription factor [Dermabacter sp.]